MVLYKYDLIPNYSYLFIQVDGHIFLAITYYLILVRINKRKKYTKVLALFHNLEAGGDRDRWNSVNLSPA